MRHIHSIYDTDQHFIINPINRGITSEADKVTLMQNDHLSERFTFELPRYIEGHDMSLTEKVEIHYNNIDGANKRLFNADVYEADDLQISPDSDDVIICSWLISKNATTYAGTLNFVLRFVCYEEEEISYQWFTDVFTGIKVVGGIYNAQVLDERYGIDIIEQWRREIVGQTIEATNKAVAAAAEAERYAANTAEIIKDQVTEVANEIINDMQEAAEITREAKEIVVEAADVVSTSATKAQIAEANAWAYMNSASVDAVSAEANADISKSYAVGGTGSRENEDTDNSKYYSDVSRNLFTEAKTKLDEAEQTLSEFNKSQNMAAFSMNYETGNLEFNDPERTWSINPETGNLEWEVK